MSAGSGPSRSLFARLELAVARRLFRLPPRVQVLLAGGKPRVVEGQALHPEMQLLLAARRLTGGKALRGPDPNVVRRSMRAEAMQFSGESPPLASVRELRIPTPEGGMRARHYAPRPTAEAPPLLVFFHGGGFVTGDLDTHDEPCRILCHDAGVHVLSVEYRLAPEHRFPSCLEDGVAAFLWARDNAAVLGADPSRVGVGGDSAGGNISAVVAQHEHREGRPTPAFQLLIYPVADSVTHRPSRELFAEGLFLERSDIDWFENHYLGERLDLRTDPRVSPLLAPDLSGLPPAVVITSGFDPLRDEGDAYAAALRAAGCHVSHRPMPGMIHGFLNMGGVSPTAMRCVREIAGERLRAISRR